MYRDKRIILIAPAWNEEVKVAEVVRRAVGLPGGLIDCVLVVDDGSTDRTAQVARDGGARVESLSAVMGVGAAIRRGYDIARAEGFDIAVVIAGNNKDAPEEITRLLDPVCDGKADFVMGSRFLEGGQYGGDMPAYRKLATRLHPFLLGLFCGRRITESTNGYRALRTEILDDPRIRLDQRWLDHYELEVYLLMKLLRLRYRCREVPVSKIYPPRAIGRTKMRPFVDWWRILSPIFLIGLGLRR
jgi:dolichol-phosphate mannosyltransferase